MDQAQTLDKCIQDAKEGNLWGISGPEGLLYKGHNIFDIYISQEANAKFENVISDEYAKGNIASSTEEGVVRYQECYLGYCPSKDQFITGFDIFGEQMEGYALSFKVQEGLIEEVKGYDLCPIGGFYIRIPQGLFWQLDNWKENGVEQMIHIRLD